MSTATPTAGLYLCPEMAGTFITTEEFDAVQDCDRDYRYELVNGILIVSPPASLGERGPNEELGYLLRLYRDNHPEGAALDYTAPECHVPTENRRRADRSIWAGLGRTPDNRRDRPTIVVEFVSAGKRDRERDYVIKRKEYLASGIEEYWVIDRFARRMTVIRQSESAGGDPDEIVVEEGGSYETPRLPGFVLPLNRLLSEADRLEQARDADRPD